jgi:hypothetical protein
VEAHTQRTVRFECCVAAGDDSLSSCEGLDFDNSDTLFIADRALRQVFSVSGNSPTSFAFKLVAGSGASGSTGDGTSQFGGAVE